MSLYSTYITRTSLLSKITAEILTRALKIFNESFLVRFNKRFNYFTIARILVLVGYQKLLRRNIAEQSVNKAVLFSVSAIKYKSKRQLLTLYDCHFKNCNKPNSHIEGIYRQVHNYKKYDEGERSLLRRYSNRNEQQVVPRGRSFESESF